MNRCFSLLTLCLLLALLAITQAGTLTSSYTHGTCKLKGILRKSCTKDSPSLNYRVSVWLNSYNIQDGAGTYLDKTAFNQSIIHEQSVRGLDHNVIVRWDASIKFFETFEMKYGDCKWSMSQLQQKPTCGACESVRPYSIWTKPYWALDRRQCESTNGKASTVCIKAMSVDEHTLTDR
jgi:hypothetical protein